MGNFNNIFTAHKLMILLLFLDQQLQVAKVASTLDLLNEAFIFYFLNDKNKICSNIFLLLKIYLDQMNTCPLGGIHLVSCEGVLGVSRCGQPEMFTEFYPPQGLGVLNPFLFYLGDKVPETFLAISHELFITERSSLHQNKDYNCSSHLV